VFFPPAPDAPLTFNAPSVVFLSHNVVFVNIFLLVNF
jgi:hypothetical protein